MECVFIIINGHLNTVIMEKKIKTPTRSLVISFAGCTKKDNADKKDGDGQDRYRPRRHSDHAKQTSSQLSYKF